jgi:hypothetical protein
LRSSIGKHYWTESTLWFITPSLSIYIGNILLNLNRTPLLPEEGTTAFLLYTAPFFRGRSLGIGSVFCILTGQIKNAFGEYLKTL